MRKIVDGSYQRKVYIVVHEWNIEGNNGIFVKVFDTLEKARRFMKEVFNEIRNDVPNYEYDQSARSCSVWKSGFFAEDHDLIVIQDKEIE